MNATIVSKNLCVVGAGEDRFLKGKHWEDLQGSNPISRQVQL